LGFGQHWPITTWRAAVPRSRFADIDTISRLRRSGRPPAFGSTWSRKAEGLGFSIRSSQFAVRSSQFAVPGSEFWGSVFCLLSSVFCLLPSAFSGFGPSQPVRRHRHRFTAPTGRARIQRLRTNANHQGDLQAASMPGQPVDGNHIKKDWPLEFHNGWNSDTKDVLRIARVDTSFLWRGDSLSIRF
jgi:hypothetical protein